MMQLFTLENIFTLGMLILLQVVLGLDNLLYISLESKRAPVEKQAFVRKFGIGLAIVLRIILLFVLIEAISYFREPFLNISFEPVIKGEFNVHAFIVLLGGVFHNVHGF